METLSYRYVAARRLTGNKQAALVGVVGSGNLEVLLERSGESERPDDTLVCRVEINTAIKGYGALWSAVLQDFVDRYSPGGLRISINDGGARPDTVSLRLAQGARLMEQDDG